MVPRFLDLSHSHAKVKQGLVAFLDILGFRNLTISPEVASVVFDVLDRAVQIRDLMSSIVNPFASCDQNVITECQVTDAELEIGDKLASMLWERISVSVISDSMVCTADLAGLEDENKTIVVSIFTRMLSEIYSEMMLHGLPIRGGISYGDFYTNGDIHKNKPANVFLGKAIFDAYQLEESVKGSVIVFNDVAKNQAKEFYSLKIPGSSIETTYPDICEAKAPIEVSSHIELQNRLCINIPKLDHDLNKSFNRVECCVAGMFAEHGKSTDSESV